MPDQFKAIRDEQLQKSSSNNLFDEMFPAADLSTPEAAPQPTEIAPEQPAPIVAEEPKQEVAATLPGDDSTVDQPNVFDELFPQEDKTNDTNVFEEMFTPHDRQNDVINPDEYLGGTPLAAIFKKGVKGVLKKAQDTQFMEWLVTTPMAEHYAKLGAEVDAGRQLERLGIPETFDVPSLYVPTKEGKVEISTKYPPHVRALLEASGGDVNETKDRMILGIFIDGLIGKGYVNLANKFLKGGLVASSKASWLKTASSMSDESLDILNRQAAKSTEITEEVAKTEAAKMIKEIQDVKGATPTTETLEATTRKLDEITVGSHKFKVAADGTISPMGAATKQDLYEQGIKQAASEANIDNVAKAMVGDEVLPTPGKFEFDNIFSKGWLSWFRSPQYYARNVYDSIGKLERQKAIIKTDLMKDIDPFLRLKGKDVAQKVGRIADGLDDAAIAGNQLGEEGAQLLSAYQRMTKKAADVLGLPEEKRITNYLTRIWDDYSGKDVDFPIPEELTMWVKENRKHLKGRKGGVGYNLDVVRAAEVYVDWVADFTARKAHKTKVFDEVRKIKKIDSDRGDVADSYVKNYFGELRKDPEHKIMKRFASFVKKSFADATIANNIVTFATNLTQAPYFGAARIGYRAYFKGLRMAMGKGGKSEAAKRAKDILDRSGVIANQSMETLNQGLSISDMALKKLGVSDVNINKLSEFSFKGMQMSEDFNKASVYLGAYDDVLTRIQTVNTAKAAGKQLKGAERWLNLRGVSASDIPEEAAHKYARSATVDTQLDYSKAGMSGAAINPAISTGYMYMTFPVKAAEMMLHTTKAAVKQLAKDPLGAIHTPEVQNVIRMGLSSAAMIGLADTAGVSVKRIVSLENLTPTLLPLWQAAAKGMSATYRAYEGDPDSYRDVVKALTIGLGFKGAAPMWQMQSMLQTAIFNANKKDKSNWDIYTSSGKYMYSTTPGEFVFDLMTPFEDIGEEDYFEGRKKQMKSKRQIAYARRRIDKARLNSNALKEREEKQNLKAFKKELEKQKRESGTIDSVTKRKERELRDRLRRNK